MKMKGLTRTSTTLSILSSNIVSNYWLTFCIFVPPSTCNSSSPPLHVASSSTRIYENPFQQDASVTSSFPYFILPLNMPERPESGGPCWLLKLRQMGYKWKVPWLIHWAHGASSRYFYPAEPARVSAVQNIFFPHRTLFHFMCPHHPAT
jgi:hypothetical protein